MVQRQGLLLIMVQHGATCFLRWSAEASQGLAGAQSPSPPMVDWFLQGPETCWPSNHKTMVETMVDGDEIPGFGGS